MLNEIINYIITEGTTQTQEGYYSFTFEEIAEQFNLTTSAVRKLSNRIIEGLYMHEEVAYCDCIGNEITVGFYLDYCSLEANDFECEMV